MATVKKATKNKKSESSVESSVLKTVSRFASETLLAPIVTEKTAKLSSKNVVVFRVATTATRVAVKQAVKELYGIIPEKVNMITKQSRFVRFGKTVGKTKRTKKAMVFLPEGKTLDVFAA